MLEPYKLPHECESAEIAELLARLTPRQRRVLRAYVWQVELGEKTLVTWLGEASCPVARSTWYALKDNADFQQALTAYRRAGLTWGTSQEERSVKAAQRRIRHAASGAAERLADQAQADVGQFFKVVERWTDEPLPSQEIIREEVRDNTLGLKQKFFLVRQAVLDLSRLADPRYSRMVKKFSDSPTKGVAIEVYDAQRAAESILDRADLETASKAETHVGVAYDLGRLNDDELDELDRIRKRLAGAQGGEGAAAPD